MTPKDCLSLSLCVSGVLPLLDLFHSGAVGINGDDLIGGAHTFNNEIYSSAFYCA